jgi:hypothetical protein
MGSISIIPAASLVNRASQADLHRVASCRIPDNLKKTHSNRNQRTSTGIENIKKFKEVDAALAPRSGQERLSRPAA